MPENNFIAPDLAGSNLPPVLRGIVAALGWRRAEEFLRIHGGTVVVIPQYTTRVLHLSTEELLRLRTNLKNHCVDPQKFQIALPKVDKLLKRKRDTIIRRNRDLPLNRLAREYSLTTRQILNIKNSEDVGEHPDLF